VPHLRTLCAAVALILTTTGTVFGLESRVAVVTSYPEEMMSRFEAAFERANSGVDVQFIWKQSRDALPYLQGAGREEADVYWAPSPADGAVDGLGPLHNRLSCVACHPRNGRGAPPEGKADVVRREVLRMVGKEDRAFFQDQDAGLRGQLKHPMGERSAVRAAADDNVIE
jgi:hypothetical protein